MNHKLLAATIVAIVSAGTWLVRNPQTAFVYYHGAISIRGGITVVEPLPDEAHLATDPSLIGIAALAIKKKPKGMVIPGMLAPMIETEWRCTTDEIPLRPTDQVRAFWIDRPDAMRSAINHFIAGHIGNARRIAGGAGSFNEVYWPAIVASMGRGVFVVSLVSVGWMAYTMILMHRRAGVPCKVCGYNLERLEVPRCPECGAPVVETQTQSTKHR